MCNPQVKHKKPKAKATAQSPLEGLQPFELRQQQQQQQQPAPAQPEPRHVPPAAAAAPAAAPTGTSCLRLQARPLGTQAPCCSARHDPCLLYLTAHMQMCRPSSSGCCARHAHVLVLLHLISTHMTPSSLQELHMYGSPAVCGLQVQVSGTLGLDLIVVGAAMHR